jgi:hypothetical protein
MKIPIWSFMGHLNPFFMWGNRNGNERNEIAITFAHSYWLLSLYEVFF